MIQVAPAVAQRPSVSWSAADAVPLSHHRLTAGQRFHIEDLMYRFGAASVSYDPPAVDSLTLFSPCHQGLINILPDGRFWHVGGGLICPNALKLRMIRWLKAVAAARAKTLLLFSVRPDDVCAFRESGYEINGLGMEPVLPLGNVTWKGRDFSWVRRQTSFCQRMGLQFEELDSSAGRAAHAAELNAVLQDDLKERPLNKPLRILEAAFDPSQLGRQRVFVARHSETNELAGFVMCTPMLNGTEWAFETYRKRASAPRGTIAFLFRSAVDQLQSEGARKVSLCIVLGKEAEHSTTDPEGHWLIRRGLRIQYRHLNVLFNTQGQDYFKQRFRPTYEPRYACVTPGSSAQSLLSFMRTSGAMLPSPFNLARRLARSLTNRLRTG